MPLAYPRECLLETNRALRSKLEAVRLAQQPDVSVAAVARDLDLHDHVLRRWIKQYEEDPANAFPGGGQMKPQDAEIAALRDAARFTYGSHFSMADNRLVGRRPAQFCRIKKRTQAKGLRP